MGPFGGAESQRRGWHLARRLKYASLGVRVDGPRGTCTHGCLGAQSWFATPGLEVLMRPYETAMQEEKTLSWSDRIWEASPSVFCLTCVRQVCFVVDESGFMKRQLKFMIPSACLTKRSCANQGKQNRHGEKSWMRRCTRMHEPSRAFSVQACEAVERSTDLVSFVYEP